MAGKEEQEDSFCLTDTEPPREKGVEQATFLLPGIAAIGIAEE